MFPILPPELWTHILADGGSLLLCSDLDVSIREVAALRIQRCYRGIYTKLSFHRAPWETIALDKIVYGCEIYRHRYHVSIDVSILPHCGNINLRLSNKKIPQNVRWINNPNEVVDGIPGITNRGNVSYMSIISESPLLTQLFQHLDMQNIQTVAKLSCTIFRKKLDESIVAELYVPIVSDNSLNVICTPNTRFYIEQEINGHTKYENGSFNDVRPNDKIMCTIQIKRLDFYPRSVHMRICAKDVYVFARRSRL